MGAFKMKEIIYLDTDFLHSFLAQTQDGLETEKSTERSEEESDTLESEKGQSSRNMIEVEGSTGQFTIPGVLETPKGDIRLRLQPGGYTGEKSINSQSEAEKELITKKLHDNALINFEEYMKNENKMKEVKRYKDLKGYVKIKSQFQLIDLNILETLLNKETISLITAFDRSFDLIKKDGVGIEEIEGMMRLLKTILPSSAFVKINNAIVPIKEEFLREKHNQLIFKYGFNQTSTEVTIVGKVTRKLQSGNHPNPQSGGKNTLLNVSGDINAMIDQLMNNVIGISDSINDVVINPVAIYFE